MFLRGQLVSIISIFFLLSCSGGGDSRNEKSVDELEYAEIARTFWFDSGEGIEYHGESLPTEAIDNIKIDKKGEGCQQRFVLKNLGEKPIELIFYIQFKIGQWDSYSSRKVTLEAHSELDFAKTTFCYGGKTYPLRESIVQAKYR